MHVTIKGKNTDVSERVKAHAEHKLTKLQRFGDRIVTMDVEFSEERNPRVRDPHRVEVTCTTTSLPIRAEASGPDAASAIDAVLSRLERQVKRLKEKGPRRTHHGPSRTVTASEAEHLPTESTTLQDDYEQRVVRRKQVETKPMAAGEAAMVMDLLGHDFYLFTDAETDRPAVVYRRRDGDFGVLVAGGSEPAET